MRSIQMPQHAPAVRPARREQTTLLAGAQGSDGSSAGMQAPHVDRLIAVATDVPHLLLPLICNTDLKGVPGIYLR